MRDRNKKGAPPSSTVFRLSCCTRMGDAPLSRPSGWPLLRQHVLTDVPGRTTPYDRLRALRATDSSYTAPVRRFLLYASDPLYAQYIVVVSILLKVATLSYSGYVYYERYREGRTIDVEQTILLGVGVASFLFLMVHTIATFLRPLSRRRRGKHIVYGPWLDSVKVVTSLLGLASACTSLVFVMLDRSKASVARVAVRVGIVLSCILTVLLDVSTARKSYDVRRDIVKKMLSSHEKRG